MIFVSLLGGHIFVILTIRLATQNRVVLIFSLHHDLKILDERGGVNLLEGVVEDFAPSKWRLGLVVVDGLASLTV